MPTYIYEVVKTGKTIDVQQRITEPAHDVLEVDGEFVRVRRLISGAPAVFLEAGPSGGWSSTGYAKAPHERKAEAILGRPLRKAAR